MRVTSWSFVELLQEKLVSPKTALASEVVEGVHEIDLRTLRPRRQRRESSLNRRNPGRILVSVRDDGQSLRFASRLAIPFVGVREPTPPDRAVSRDRHTPDLADLA